MLDFYALSQLATRLTGKKWVSVEFQRPPWKGFGGAALANPGGEFTIYLDPSMTEVKQYHVFLHEVAHVKLHGHRMEPTTTQALQVAPEQHRPETGLKALQLAVLEEQADTLANKWDSQARRDAGMTANIDNRLQALYLYGG